MRAAPAELRNSTQRKATFIFYKDLLLLYLGGVHMRTRRRYYVQYNGATVPGRGKSRIILRMSKYLSAPELLSSAFAIGDYGDASYATRYIRLPIYRAFLTIGHIRRQ